MRIGPAGFLFFFYSVFPPSPTPPRRQQKQAGETGTRGSIAIEFEGGVQGVLYCATNIVGRFRFNRVAQEEEENYWGGGVAAGQRGNCPKNRSHHHHISNLTPRQPQLHPYRTMYTFHKVNIYGIYTHAPARAHTSSLPLFLSSATVDKRRRDKATSK